MKRPFTGGKIEVNIVAEGERTQRVADLETPFRIAILGDFSGRRNRGLSEPVAKHYFHLIDRDNFDEVLSKLKVEIHLPILGKNSPPVILRFSELDDFHPDLLFENIEVFEPLRETRQSLKDPSAFAAAAKEFEDIKKPPEPSAPLSSLRRDIETTGDLLEQVLEETQEKPHKGEPSQRPSELDEFLGEIVKPHLVPKPHPRQAEMIAKVDAATAELMRRLLHHPDFQAIEAAWRALYFLVSRLETDKQLKLYLLDLSKGELTADLFVADDLRSTGIYKLFVEQTVETPGGEPWAVLAGNYTFSSTPKDVELLGRMAKIARAAGAPFIAAAHPHLLGCESLDQTPDPDDWKQSIDEESSRAWKVLRKPPEASYLGLALPRFLLRLPYGADTEPTELFNFEEIEGKPEHEHYLWGSPSLACVYLLAQAFTRYGWDLQPGMIQDIEGLPIHIYKEQGESRSKPCAEVVLTERAAEAILDKGLMPLLSFKNQDRIRLARFQSLADPPTPLIGRWR